MSINRIDNNNEMQNQIAVQNLPTIQNQANESQSHFLIGNDDFASLQFQGSTQPQSIFSNGNFSISIENNLADLKSNSSWNAVTTSQGVSVFAKTVNRNGTTATAYKGVTQLSSPMSTQDFITRIYGQTENYPGNVKYVEFTKDLQFISATAKKYYQVVNISNVKRHSVMDIQVLQSGSDTYIMFKETTEAEASAQNPDITFTPLSQGYWKLDSEKNTLTYCILTQPGGWVPASAANIGTRTSIPTAVNSMEAWIRELE